MHAAPAPVRPGPLSSRRPHRGVVETFDADRGLGTVSVGSGSTSGGSTGSGSTGSGSTGTVSVLPFHCTAIADGTRRIAVGTAVAFVVAPGTLGRLEARGIVPDGPPGS
jgi:cold shock CspA family protein